MDQSRLSLLALHFIPGIGNYTIRQLVSYCGSAEKVFKTPKGRLRKIPGIGDITAEALTKGKPFVLTEREIRKAEKEKASLIFFFGLINSNSDSQKRMSEGATLNISATSPME